MTGGGLLLGAWVITLLARRWNRQDRAAAFYLAVASAAVLSIAGSAGMVLGPWTTGLDPTSRVYPAIVWILVGWTVVHVAVGLIMQLYCAARRCAGRMTHHYDAVGILATSVYLWGILERRDRTVFGMGYDVDATDQ